MSQPLKRMRGKMNIDWKILGKAFAYVMAVVIGSVSIGVALAMITTYFSATALLILMVVGMIVYLIYSYYKFFLSQAEYDRKYK